MARNKAQKKEKEEVLTMEDQAAEVEVCDDSGQEASAEGQECETDGVEDVEETAEDDISEDDMQEQNSEAQDKLLRMAAEFENYKKRMVRERVNAIKYAEEGILKDLLPTIDNLERALDQDNNANDINVLLEGVELTLKGLLATVAKYDLTPLESAGEPFDPNFHEALVMEASSEVPAQTVIREFEKGYQYKDRLLRAAKVIVSKGEES